MRDVAVPADLMKDLNQIESVVLENSMSSVFSKLPSVFHIIKLLV